MNIILGDLPGGTNKTLAIPAGPVRDSRGLAWQVGQILQGRVIGQVVEGAFLLDIQGREILAHSSLPLIPGQTLSLQVQEQQGNQCLMKVLFQDGQVINDDLRTILARLGFKDTPLYRSLVQKFLAYRLPLQPELLRQVEQAVSCFSGEATMSEGAAAVNYPGPPGKEGMDVALQALKMGIPMRAETLRYLQEFMQQEGEKGREGITRLARFIPSLAGLLAGLEGEKGERAKDIYNQVKNMVASLVLKPGEGRERLALQLFNLLSLQLPEGSPLVENTRSMEKRLQQGQTRSASRLLPLNELREKLNSLLQVVKQAARESGQEATARELLHTGERIAGQLAGQQVFQTGARDNGLQGYFYFALPIQQEGEVTTWGQLVIRKEGGRTEPVDSRNFTMTILLHTENLGSLSLEIRTWQGEVKVQGQVEKEWVGQLIDAAWPDLQEGFASLGYRLHGYKWQVGAIPGQLLPLLVEPKDITIGPGLLDKKV
ncbi:MAG: hypothetical protein PWQ18_934 [Clostridia bacterium]|nr:hypothetical protein [Clostridia bacterium]